MSSSIVNLLDVDPDIAAAVTPGGGEAPPGLEVRTVVLRAGDWDPGRLDLGRGAMGLLVTRGLILRRTHLRQRTSAELLGAGDLLRPWQTTAPPFRADWRVVEDVTLALLDRNAALRIARHPEALLAVLEREITRSRRTSERCTTAQLTSTRERLQIEFSRLAERWGRVGPDGIRLRLALTHETIGQLIGVRRPAVTTALGQLTREGLIEPLPGGGWVLHGFGLPAARADGEVRVLEEAPAASGAGPR